MLKVALSIFTALAITTITGTAYADGNQSISADKMKAEKSASEKPAVKQQVPPPSMDTNKDGKPDAWDRDANGIADAWDVNGDGQPDQVDNNGDGRPDDEKSPAPAPETADPPR